jgi:hypothetical protein
MSRSTSHIGLSQGGLNFLNKFKITVIEKGVRIFPDGQEVRFERDVEEFTFKKEYSGATSGMFEEIQLRKFTMPDNTVLYEYVQECFWESGPVEFTALKQADGTPIVETLWTQEEIKSYSSIDYTKDFPAYELDEE